MLLLLAALLVSRAASQLDCAGPGSVTQLEVWNLTSRTMSVRWAPPPDTARQCLRGYRVCWSAEPDGLSPRCSELPGDSTAASLADMAVCANYTVEVVSLGVAGNSSAAVLSSYSGAGPIGSASVLTVNESTLSVAWGYDVFTNQPCSAHFLLLVCSSAQQDSCRNYTVPLQATPEVLVSGLAVCRQYLLSLVAVDNRGLWSDPYQLPGYVDGLGEPTDITLVDVSSSQVFVSWTLPRIDAVCSHEPILCHVREAGEARVCQSFATESLASFTLTELQACASYSIQVVILTPGNNFVASPVRHSTRPTNSTLLARVEAREVSDTSLEVTWLPMYEGATCVREYSMCWEPPGNCTSVPGSATSQQLTGLQPQTTYTLEMTALLTDGSRSDTVITRATTSTSPTTPATDSSAVQLLSRINIGLLPTLVLLFKISA